jgi:hypothetical protein
LASLPFPRRPFRRIIQLVGAIGGGLLFGLFAEAFGFELPNLSLGLIEFRLQHCISLNRASMQVFPIAHVAPQLAHLLAQFGILTPQFVDFPLQLFDNSHQRPKPFLKGNPFHKRSTHGVPQ